MKDEEDLWTMDDETSWPLLNTDPMLSISSPLWAPLRTPPLPQHPCSPVTQFLYPWVPSSSPPAGSTGQQLPDFSGNSVDSQLWDSPTDPVTDDFQTLRDQPLDSDLPKQKFSKVERTPDVNENGERLCVYCSGRVGPDQCGDRGIRRWRCRNKRCRKWYGSVKTDEPAAKAAKNGGSGSCRKLNPLKNSDRMEADNKAANASDTTAEPHSGDTVVAEPVALCDVQPKKKRERPAKRQSEECDSADKGTRPKRKYNRKSKSAEDKSPDIRCVSPLSAKALLWKPSAMERRARWWTDVKQESDESPNSEFVLMSELDCATAFIVIAKSMQTAARTRSDEPGSVSGALDLLMDGLLSSIGPLLSMITLIPAVAVDNDVLGTIRNTCVVHTPVLMEQRGRL